MGTVDTKKARMRRNGFTLIELITVLAMVGVILAIAIPRMRVSPVRKVGSAARQLAGDLEGARNRSLSAKRASRVVFDVAGNTYVGYLDDDGDGTFAQSQSETQALRVLSRRDLAVDVRFGRGGVGPVPGDAGSGAVTFDNDRVEFDTRGITLPFGERGTIYFVYRDDPNVVAAVAVSGSASFKIWVYRGGQWQ